jgi:hypothetical protein
MNKKHSVLNAKLTHLGTQMKDLKQSMNSAAVRITKKENNTPKTNSIRIMQITGTK